MIFSAFQQFNQILTELRKSRKTGVMNTKNHALVDQVQAKTNIRDKWAASNLISPNQHQISLSFTRELH